MNNIERAEHCVRQMTEQDAFSRWLNIELLDIRPGQVTAQMTVREEMLNGFHVSHGGVVFSLADSALAFAANTHGWICMTVENSIRYYEKVVAGDRITALAREQQVSKRIGHYHVDLTNQHDRPVAFFSGTVYRTSRSFE